MAWTRTLPTGETYRFLGVNTADNSGDPFSILFPFGDNAGLDPGELAFIDQELARPASLALVFGHHPVTDTGDSDDTWLFYGHEDFVHYLDLHRASAYGYGHTHASSQVLFEGNDYTGHMAGDGIAYNNIASLGKSSSNNYSVVAIDCNGVSAVPATVGTWPVVLITAPLSAYVGAEPNPYAYAVPAAGDNPIRALVFDAAANPQVTYRIDAGTTWYPMARVAEGPLWHAAWNASALPAGDHTIEVRAAGTTTRSQVITVKVGSPTAAVAGDADGDRRSDVFWRHTTNGDVWLWPMDGAARTAEIVRADGRRHELGDPRPGRPHGRRQGRHPLAPQDHRRDLPLADGREHAALGNLRRRPSTRPTTSSARAISTATGSRTSSGGT